jgi:hypothetical protein
VPCSTVDGNKLKLTFCDAALTKLESENVVKCIQASVSSTNRPETIAKGKYHNILVKEQRCF